MSHSKNGLDEASFDGKNVQVNPPVRHCDEKTDNCPGISACNPPTRRLYSDAVKTPASPVRHADDSAKSHEKEDPDVSKSTSQNSFTAEFIPQRKNHNAPVNEGIKRVWRGEEKVYRTPNVIPCDKQQFKGREAEGRWHHLNKHRRKSNGRDSVFHQGVRKPVLEKMILDTCKRPDQYKIDRNSCKTIYRFSEYDQVIGYKGEDKTECRCLVVVAKWNSWIKTAYPVKQFWY